MVREPRRRLGRGTAAPPEGMPRSSAGRSGSAWAAVRLTHLAALLTAGAILALIGCSSREALHSALRVMDVDIERGTQRGASLVSTGGAPEDAFGTRMVDVNTRVSSTVILRTAGCLLPADVIAYEIAGRGDASESGVRRAAQAGVKRAEKELICLATIQMPKASDPAEVRFALQTSTGVEYPPVVVETPTLLRDINLMYDPTAAPTGLYRYVIRFPIRGGPGVPPIGPGVSSVSLVVRSHEGEALVPFPLRSREL